MEILQLTNEIYKNSIQEIIENNLKITDYEIECTAGSAKGDNFLGVVYRIRVISKKENFTLILKIPPLSAARRDQCNSRGIFLNEIEFYEKVCEIYRNFQVEKGIKIESEGFFEFPHCYKSINVEPYEALFLEDLKAKNFELADRKKSFTKDHVLLVLNALAKMHALSFSLKDQKPELIEKYFTMEDIFSKSYSDKNSVTYSWIRTQIDMALEMIEKLEESDFKNRVLGVLKGDFFEQFDRSVDGRAAEPYGVLCHGDV